VIVDANTQQQLFDLAETDPEAKLTIDLASQTLTLPDGSAVEFPIAKFSKTCLLQGVDQLGYLQKHENAVKDYEKIHPARVNTLG